MKLRFAFAGFRHSHIHELYRLVQQHPSTVLAAAAEDDLDESARASSEGVVLTHASIDAMLSDANAYDVVAIGDYFSRHGSVAIRALEYGRHVILDKPICTSIDEWRRLRELSRSRGLNIGCQLSLPDNAAIRTLIRLVQARTIGHVHTVMVSGQHPLLYGKRPMWYFEAGKHGGTINDIGVHAFDILPAILGNPIDEIIAARTWNDRLVTHGSFQVGAQFMLRMSDMTGILGDVSYSAPDSQGYTIPQYWRFTLHGDDGILETSVTQNDVKLWRNGAKTVQTYSLDSERTGGYLDDFIQEVSGNPNQTGLTTERILESSRIALITQHSADAGLAHVRI